MDLKRVASAVGGVFKNSAQMTSSNSKYYVHASSFSFYVYKLPEMELYRTFCQDKGLFVFVKISPAEQDRVIAITREDELYSINIETKECIVKKKFLEGKALCAEFSNDGRFFYVLLKSVCVFQIINTEDLTSRCLSFDSSSPRMFSVYPGPGHRAILSETSKTMYLIDFDSGKKEKIHIKSLPFSIKYDPLNESNILFITVKNKWSFLLATPDIKHITKSKNTDTPLSSGDWIPAMPGHIITGNTENGVINVWSVASGDCVFTQTVGNTGITNVTRVSNKDFVITFNDASLAVYDVITHEVNVKVQKSHTNTILANLFLPNDPSTLVTTGADGRICFWNIPNLKQQTSIYIPSDPGMVYSAAISNGGGYIATGSKTGVLVVFSLKTGQVVYREKIFNGIVMGLQWSPNDPNLIAASSDDNLAKIININTKDTAVKISVKGQFKKLKWSEKSGSLAIACANGNLYVRLDGGTYYIMKGSQQPLFDVAWNPFDEDIIAATDDGGNVILFNVKEKTSRLAHGHEGKARPIVWSPTQKDLLISGGYDGTIDFWNASSMKIITKYKIHSSHIYGIAINPAFPNLISTVSRDSTVRLWSFDRLLPDEKIDALLRGDKFVGAKFSPFNGASSLEKLIHRISRDGTKISFRDDDLIHVHDISKISKKRLQKMMSSLPGDQSLYERSKTYRKAAMDAAELALKSGNAKKFCELMFICGEYDISLAIAPVVSYNFWQSLVISRAKLCKDPNERADLLLVSGNPKIAIDELIKEECYESAMLVAAALREKTFQPKTKIEFQKHSGKEPEIPFIKDEFHSSDYGLYTIASHRAQNYAEKSEPLLSAASLLTIGDVEGAIHRLINCGEIIWAVDLARATKRIDSHMSELIFKYCAFNKRGKDAFKLLSPHQKRDLVSFLMFKDEKERDDFYKENGLKSVGEYLNEAKHSRGLALCQFKILAGRINEGIKEAVDYIRKLMANDVFNFPAANNAANVIRNAAPHVDTTQPEWVTAVAICHYFGVYTALWKGFSGIIGTIGDAFKACAEKSGAEWLIKRIPEIQTVCALCIARDDPNKAKIYSQRTGLPENAAVDKAIKYRGKKIDGRVTSYAMSTGFVPVDINMTPPVSICSNDVPNENIFILEDGKSIMTVSEAIMFFNSTPFSPLPTSHYHVPY